MAPLSPPLQVAEGEGPEGTPQLPPLLLLVYTSSSSPELNLQWWLRGEHPLLGAPSSDEGATIEKEVVVALSGTEAEEEEEEVGAGALE